MSLLMRGLDKYAQSLGKKTESMKTLYSIHLRFLDELMVNTETYKAIFLNDLPEISAMNKYQKYVNSKKFKGQGISVPVTCFK